MTRPRPTKVTPAVWEQLLAAADARGERVVIEAPGVLQFATIGGVDYCSPVESGVRR